MLKKKKEKIKEYRKQVKHHDVTKAKDVKPTKYDVGSEDDDESEDESDGVSARHLYAIERCFSTFSVVNLQEEEYEEEISEDEFSKVDEDDFKVRKTDTKEVKKLRNYMAEQVSFRFKHIIAYVQLK